MKVLDGVRVLDLSRVLAGPYCAQLLADFGADVVKIEAPEGDENRLWPPVTDASYSANFASVNRGKRAMTLDLKTEPARALLRRLARESDVLIHSFLPDTAERLGISTPRLRAESPRLIVATISGYGAAGALASKRGYDLMVQAFAGIMSVTGEVGGPPLRCGASVIDMSTGLSLYGGIVTALLGRQATGQGTWVHGSLLETGVSLLGHMAVAWMQTGIVAEPQGSGSWLLVPYQAFRCADGWLLAGAPNDGAWKRFCEALEWPELAEDTRFASNDARVERRAELVPMLEARFRERTVAYWIGRLEARSVACSEVHRVDRVMSHPQVLATHMRIEAGGQPLVGTPFKLADGGGTAEIPAPALGAHTDAVLTGFGLSRDEIAGLRQGGAFGPPPI
ncbi:MAG TPA: CoA transferase [Rhodopila sp.]|nr:CoA transferase [Rhodopila sp.]